ncbi:histidinol-phosphatase HisJ family protein [Caloramator sp. E03]|uniref:histidinol-phosphatase HisJ family protein n=1 Tax=Caloramator sp. E03 TaxID=2576307 RepID=UPI001110F998|nr:histidinol-phosphatase HisJ family protein [Caloramator sp. E03]QCX32617.1 histidinol-phosphatase HisJ family protein [Caloramator sp. E03]
MFADYHVHSNFSDDSTCEMEDEIKKAISLGIDEICFTEHVDYGVKTDLNCNYEAYIKEFQRCKEKYKNEINIKLGIEFGIQVDTIEKFKEDFDKYNFDFVILSCHQVDNKEFWTYEFQEGKTQQEYNERYYEEILKVIKKYDEYSVLGHLDMIKRYDKFGEYPDENVKELIIEILKHVIEHEKGIEVNTSSFRYKLADLTPSKYILKLYKDLGGRIITIGSDAHKDEDIGHNIQIVKDELKKIGFKEFCTFEKMKPIFHQL